MYRFSDKDSDHVNNDVVLLNARTKELEGHILTENQSAIPDRMDKHVENNITYVVSDPINLQIQKKSADLIFANSVLMYMTDCEVIEFVTSALTWLKPRGLLEIKESCSDPAIKVNKDVTFYINNIRPIKYRYNSLYIQLLRNIQIREENGSRWRFDLKWSVNAATHIEV